MTQRELTYVPAHLHIPRQASDQHKKARKLMQLSLKVREQGNAIAKAQSGWEIMDAYQEENQPVFDSSEREILGCSNSSCDAVWGEVKKFKTCSRCKRVRYCSTRCQRAHWKSGHKRECNKDQAPSAVAGIAKLVFRDGQTPAHNDPVESDDGSIIQTTYGPVTGLLTPGDEVHRQKIAAALAGAGAAMAAEAAAAALQAYKAAVPGIAQAQYELACRYASGDGVVRDPAKTWTWMSRAAAQGCSQAIELLPRLRQLREELRPVVGGTATVEHAGDGALEVVD